MRKLAGLVVLTLMNPLAADADTRCETKTQICMDAKAGGRPCLVTICKDDSGNIVRTDVVILRDAQTGVASPPKVIRPQVAPQGKKQ